MDSDVVRSWIEQGKQVGKSLSIDKDGRRFHVSVAIQKQQDGYKVVANEMDEARMWDDEFDRHDSRMFGALEDAVNYIETTTPMKLAELAPRKGQRWFR
jgi:hypothetical protein